jgi:4-amino-4-deoxy-L-arabinose transferase-like glycosyltransferase
MSEPLRQPIERYSPPDAVDFMLGVLTLLVVTAFLAILSVDAGTGTFFADECFHAAVVRWILDHGSLPVRLPEFYSGYAYTYPPLFHVLGATLARVAGLGALPWFNVVVSTLTFGVLAFGPPPSVPHSARRWAILVCAANASFATYTLRFYSEALVGLWTTAAFVMLLRLCASSRWLPAIGLGFAIGLANATKTSALALLLLSLLAALFWVLRGQRRLAVQALVATALGVLIALPLWLRNQAAFGSAFYPLGARDLDPELYHLHLARFGLTAGDFYQRVSAAFGPIVIAFALAALVLALVRRRWDVSTAFLAFGAALVLAAPQFPVHDVRHVLPLIPSLALAASAVLVGAIPGRVRRWLEMALALAAVVAIGRLPGLRERLDPPDELKTAYHAITVQVPAYRTVLSLWTYDTAYHSARPATWPIPWGQTDRPIELFQTNEPSAFLAALDRHHIDAVLMPLHSSPQPFDGANYPKSFVECASELVQQGRLRVVWRSENLALLRRP